MAWTSPVVLRENGLSILAEEQNRKHVLSMKRLLNIWKKASVLAVKEKAKLGIATHGGNCTRHALNYMLPLICVVVSSLQHVFQSFACSFGWKNMLCRIAN